MVKSAKDMNVSENGVYGIPVYLSMTMKKCGTFRSNPMDFG